MCMCCSELYIVSMARITRGFDKADSSNLPFVDTFMMLDYMKNQKEFMSSEMRGVKAERLATS